MSCVLRGFAGAGRVLVVVAALLLAGCARDQGGEFIPFEKFEQLFRDGKVTHAEEVDRRISGEYTDEKGGKVAFVTEYAAEKDSAVIGLVKGSRIFHRKPTSVATENAFVAFLTGHFGMAIALVFVIAGGSYVGHVIFNHRRGRGGAGMLAVGSNCAACGKPMAAAAAYCHSCGKPAQPTGEAAGPPSQG
jgi:hypothetical protein